MSGGRIGCVNTITLSLARPTCGYRCVGGFGAGSVCLQSVTNLKPLHLATGSRCEDLSGCPGNWVNIYFQIANRFIVRRLPQDAVVDLERRSSRLREPQRTARTHTRHGPVLPNLDTSLLLLSQVKPLTNLYGAVPGIEAMSPYKPPMLPLTLAAAERSAMSGAQH